MTTRPADLYRPGSGLRLAALLWAITVIASAIWFPALVAPVIALPLVILLALRTPLDAVSLLTLFLTLLFLLPGRFVLEGFGAVGRPALLVGVVALGWMAIAVASPAIPITRGPQPLRWVLFAFSTAALASYVAAFFRPLPGIEVSGAQRGLITIASAVGIALLTADGIEDRAGLDTLLRRLVTFASATAVLGIVQFYRELELANYIRIPGLILTTAIDVGAERSDFQRVIGTAQHPIEFGVVLAAVLPLALHYAVMDPRNRSLWRFLPVMLLVAAIPMSVSRSGILAMAVALLVLLPGWPMRHRIITLGSGVIFAVAMRAVVPGLLGTIRSLFLNLENDPSIEGRTEDYALVTEFFRQTPIFGRGIYTLIPDRYFWLDNQFLLTIIDMGLVGLVTLLALFFVGAGLARGARQRSDDPAVRSLGQALAASVAGSMVTFFTYDALSFPIATGVLFLTLGCCGALWRLEDGPAGFGPWWWARRARKRPRQGHAQRSLYR